MSKKIKSALKSKLSSDDDINAKKALLTLALLSNDETKINLKNELRKTIKVLITV